jgi:hypothetical protein
MKKQDQYSNHYPRLLTPEEAERLLKDVKESSAWMRSEIKRRCAKKSGDLTVEVR